MKFRQGGLDGRLVGPAPVKALEGLAAAFGDQPSEFAQGPFDGFRDAGGPRVSDGPPQEFGVAHVDRRAGHACPLRRPLDTIVP